MNGLAPTKHVEPVGRCEQAMTLAAIAEQMGVTHARARQIEQRALRKLRRAIEDEARLEEQTPREWLGLD